MGALGVIEQTYYEMGSAQSQPCSYKSSDVTDIEVVYAKKAYQLRKNWSSRSTSQFESILFCNKQSRLELINSIESGECKGPSYRVLKKFLPPRVSGTLKPVEYAGENRFSKYCRFHIRNRPWSSAMKIFQTRLPAGKILDRGRKYSHWKAFARFSWKQVPGKCIHSVWVTKAYYGPC